MPTERCWKCQQVKRGVELCPSDDRLCPACFRENERQLSRQCPPAIEVDAAVSCVSSPAFDATAASATKTDVAVPAEGKKLRSKSAKAKNKTEAPATQQINLPTEVSEDSHSNGHTSTMSVLPAVVHAEELSELRQLVSSQQLVIKKLQGQLDYVLSFLGITDMFDESASVDNFTATADDLQSAPPANPVVDPATTNDLGSWSTVAKRRRSHGRDPHLHKTLQQSIVTAVYVDQSVRKSREASVIVSGLASADNSSDSDLFSALCVAELHLEPDIASTKRLGRLQTGKVQPLLVYLKQAEQAKQLIANAKRLRLSSDPVTREKVYINPNLTRAEAAAAYEVRAQRRLVLQRRRDRSNGATLSSSSGGHSVDPSSTDCQRDSQLPLNPTAVSFIPAAAAAASTSGSTD
jgi:hypothetical protein